MAKFSKKLRPEEETGGFEPGAEKDETFLLERLPKYPGEPSRYMPDNAVPAPEAKMEEIVPAAKSPEKEQKQTSTFPWLAAAILLLAFMGAGGWWLLKNSEQSSPEIALKKDSLHVTTENSVAPEIIIDTAGNIIAGGDSLKTDSLQSKYSQNIVDAVSVEKKSPEVLKEIPKVNPDTVPQHLIQETRTKDPVLKRSENGLYVVQVYSSPSRDDAEEWIGKLREQNAGNAIVTSQKIRGQEWYRVRFGSYATRAEAESAALKFGFAQSWIVQVR